MQPRRNRYVWMFLASWCILGSGQAAQAQLWKHFVPTPRPAPAAEVDYALSETNGPWLIVAAAFSGDGAEEQAHELARELRERYRLATYLHEMSFDFSGDARGRGLDEYGGPVRRRYQRGDKIHELSVLVGDFHSIDAPEAQAALEQIKTMHPTSLEVGHGERTTQSMAQVRQWQDQLLEKLGKKRNRGPMGAAFLTRNPLLPREYFVSKGVDPFVAKMNQGVEHSLLDCPGKYTIQVAKFRGKTMLQTSRTGDAADGSPWKWKKDQRNPLEEAAMNAQLLTRELRAHGWEAYEFHDRTESIVAIGSFQQVAQQLPDGRTLPIPEVQRILTTFGAAYDTPADPLRNIGNDPDTQRRIAEQEQQFNLRLASQQAQMVPGMNPKHVKIFEGRGRDMRVERIIPMDVHPQAIEVPKRSLSSAYSG